MTHLRFAVGVALGASLLVGVVGNAQGSPSATTLIVNASIVDGTGSPAQKGAVRIDGERIVEVGALEPKPGELVIDAQGKSLTPGFIDAIATMKMASSRCEMPRRS